MAKVELYINDKLCDLTGGESIDVDYTIFDITKIDTRGGARSYTFNLPKTNRNKVVLESAEMVNNLSMLPYTRMQARVYVDGIDMLIRFCEISSVKGSYVVNLYGANSSLFEGLKDLTLQQLDMSELDHYWNYANVLAGIYRTSGYGYGIVDYHSDSPNSYITNDAIYTNFMLPFVYVNYILNKIFEGGEYTFINSISGDTDSLIIPASEQLKLRVPKEKYSATFSASQIDVLDLRIELGYTANIGQFVVGDLIIDNSYGSTGEVYYVSGGAPGNPGVVRIKGVKIFPPGFQGGIGHTFSKGATYGTIDTVTTLQSASAVNYIPNSITNYTGSWYNVPYTPFTLEFQDSAQLSFTFNLVTENLNLQDSVAYVFIQTTDMTNAYMFPQPIVIGQGIHTNSVTINTGDVLSLFSGGTSVFELINGIDKIKIVIQVKYGASFTILEDSSLIVTQAEDQETLSEYGSRIEAISILPDITQIEFLKNYMQMFCLLPVVNEQLKTVTLTKFDSILDNIGNAYDWSDKIDWSEDYELKFIENNYGQNNYFKYTQDGDEPKPIGTDGNIQISNGNLEFEKEAVELIYAGTTSKLRLYDNQIAQIGIFEEGEYTNEKEPRILNVRRGFNSSGKQLVDTLFNYTVVSGAVNIPYFIDAQQSFNLGFENNLLPNYYDLLTNALSRVKILRLSVRLNAVDVANLDFTKPVWIKKFESYFYISSIKGFTYTESKSTMVELVKINING